MAVAVWGVFCGALLLSILLGVSVLYALLVGLAGFCLYARHQGNSPGQVLGMAWRGVKKAGTVHSIFVLIGIMTGVWRACGTIPYIVYHSVELVQPGSFVVCAFLISLCMAMLTGTSYGTTGVIGVVCMIVARANGIPELPVAGAVLSAVFFGDRMSPMSSSAQLVAQITGSDIYVNIKNMARTTILPLALCLLGYLLLSPGQGAVMQTGNITAILPGLFTFSPLLLLPAGLIVLLCVLRLRVVWTMLFSVISAAALCVVVQGVPLGSLAGIGLFGYQAPETVPHAAILNGGGILSMLNAMLIVLLSSAYSGIFERTDLLEYLQRFVHRLAFRMKRYQTMVLTSLITSIFSCSQSLSIMLTQQLCADLYTDEPARLAHDLEDTAALLPPFIPWCAACTVPLSTLGVDYRAMGYAMFLYLVPICRLLGDALRGRGEARRPTAGPCHREEVHSYALRGAYGSVRRHHLRSRKLH